MNNKNEFQSTEIVTDCMVVSSAYETYKKNIEFDRLDRTLGQWHISKKHIPHIKFVYVYLNFSANMLIKKYEIEKFEFSKKEKGWDNPSKHSFIFKKSENIQKLYDRVVQGRQYRTNKENGNMKDIEDGEKEGRFNQAQDEKSEYVHKEKKVKSTRDLLVFTKNKFFPDKNKIVFPKDVDMLVIKVDSGEDTKKVLEDYFTSKKKN